MKINFNLIMGFLLVLLLMFSFGCQINDNSQNPNNGNDQNTDTNQTNNENNQNDELSGNEIEDLINDINKNNSNELLTFSDKNELTDFLFQKNLQNFLMGSSSGLNTRNVMSQFSDVSAKMTMSESASYDSAVPSGGADDYSTTNVQYENVDEADFVKNDDRYIYMISDNKFLIIDAYDAKNAKIISEMDLFKDSNNEDNYRSSQLKELLIKDDFVLVISEIYERTYDFQKYDIMPRERYLANTLVYLFDVSDREKPNLVNQFKVSGNYYQARMHNDIVYFISKQNLDMYDIYLPRVESNTLDMTPKVHYFDRKEDNYVFNTITSISLKTKDVVDSKSFMLGYSTNLMVSENNIYLSYENQNWYYRRCYSYYCDEENDKERFYDVILPLLEGELKSDVQNIIQSESDEDKRWKQIAEVFGDFFKRAENDVDMQKKYDEMMVNIEDSLDEYDFKKEMENKKTFIHRIAIDNGLIEHKAKGEVYGSLLNQFSLDEDDGFLRVATTLSMWSGKRIQFSNVYVLNEDLKVVGEVKNIAPDERIYSTRFLGDKLYMVTFKQIDPFFVIDLKDPKNPEILGELKIPGFSTYLHPYDENTIIGIGKQTKENEWGGVDESALKISLFDVSDFSNPKEIDTYEIGERGTDSVALHEHKAFLFSKSKGLLFLPVSEVKDIEDMTKYWSSRKTTWNGLYVFDLSSKQIDLFGKVTHSEEKTTYWNYRNDATVLRSLFMDNNLYSISTKYLKINDMDNNLKELKTINLDLSNEDDLDYYPKEPIMIDPMPIID